jgi:hypothetical protein
MPFLRTAFKSTTQHKHPPNAFPHPLQSAQPATPGAHKWLGSALSQFERVRSVGFAAPVFDDIIAVDPGAALTNPWMTCLGLRFAPRTLPSAATSWPFLRTGPYRWGYRPARTCSRIRQRIDDNYPQRLSLNTPHAPTTPCKSLRSVSVPVSDPSTVVNSARTHGTLNFG